MSRFLPIALCALMLSACSRTHVSVPMPPPPANLASPCPMVHPIPALDPERAAWEAETLLGYAICAGKHRAAIEAWSEAAKPRP